MKKEFSLLFFLLLRCFAFSAEGKKNTYYRQPLTFRHLTVADGLASNVVNCMLQDHNGFLWFGTNDGLNRYDGKTFTLFKANPKDTHSLSGNHITSLYEDKNGKIWIGTFENGIAVFNPATEKFKRFVHDERDANSLNKGYAVQIYEDVEGRFWICLYGGGLELLNEKTGTFIHHVWKKNDSFSVAGNKVKAIYETAPGNYLVGTFEAGNGITDIKESGRINQYDIRTNKFTTFNIPPIPLPAAYRQGVHQLERLVNTITLGGNGTIWFGTYCGILKYNRFSNTWRCYENDNKDPTSLSHNTVEAVCEWNGKMLFGTKGGGLSVLDTAAGTFTNYLNDPLDAATLSDDNIKAICKDRENRIWIATAGGGINILEPPDNRFLLYPNKLLKVEANTRLEETTIRALCAGKNGELLIGSTEGLTILNTRTKKITLLQPKYERNGTDFKGNVCAITPSAMGNYWLGVNDKLMELDLDNLALYDYARLCRFHHFKTQHYNKQNYKSHVAVTGIIEGPDTTLFINYFGNNARWYRPVKGAFSNERAVCKARYSVQDSDGNIWSIKYKDGPDKRGGLLLINHKGQQQDFFHSEQDTNSISSNEIRTVYCDKKNRLWIATDKSLDLLDRKTGHFIHYKNIPDFPDSTINCMVGDPDDNIWLLTDDALVKMNPATKKVSRFWANEDLPVHKPESKMLYNDEDSFIYFTANEGIVGFAPKQLATKMLPPLFITGIALFDKKLPADSAAWIKKSYRLRYDENFITLYFTALNYAPSATNYYAYQLEGLSEDWIDVGNRNEVNFTNLNPGNYIFRLKSGSHKGVWEQEMVPVTIIIDPPWWKTNGFYISCFLLLAASLTGYNHYRTLAFRRQKYKLEKMVEERTVQYKIQKERAEKSEQFHRQFLANMSHEIRTPMNAVSGITQLLLEKDPKPEQLSSLQAIHQSSDMLLHIVNDILDLSKIEAGKLDLETIHFSIREIIRRVKETLKYATNRKGLLLETTIDDNIPEALIGDSFRLSQVLLNLGGNAIKFTEKGNVQIAVTEIKKENGTHHIHFSVADTGIGIAEDKLEELFENFGRVHSSGTEKYEGTGLGLSISKNLVGLMGGTISVESKSGEGSVFSFTLPMLEGETAKLSREVIQKGNYESGILNGLRVLLADDNEYNRFVVTESLHFKFDLQIDMAITGKEAVEKMKQQDYDVILMDLQMPVMDGITATRYIRTQLSSNIPIIALTASALQVEKERCMDAGMNACVSKPFSATQLIEAIANVTGRKKDAAPLIQQTQDMNEEISAPKQAVTNLSYLRDFCESDKSRMQQYIRLYLEGIPLFKEKMRVATETKKREEIIHLVHSFKPKWEMMGMDAAYRTAVRVGQGNDTPNELYSLAVFLLEETDKSVTELSRIMLF